MTTSLSLDDPWQIARTRFLAGLYPGEQEIFDNAGPENIIWYATGRPGWNVSQDSLLSMSAKLNLFISAMEDYSKALDVFTGTTHLYVTSIWGSIKVVLMLANPHHIIFGQILDTLETIGDMLPRFREFSISLKGSSLIEV